MDFIRGDWRHGVDAETIETILAADEDRAIKAVAVVHNETSTGVTSDIAAVRRAMDAAKLASEWKESDARNVALEIGT